MRAAWPKQPVARPRPTELGWPGACRSRGLAEAARGGMAEAAIGPDICPQFSTSRNRSIETLTMRREG